MDNYHESMDYTFCPIFSGQFVYALVVFSGSKLIHLFFDQCQQKTYDNEKVQVEK